MDVEERLELTKLGHAVCDQADEPGVDREECDAWIRLALARDIGPRRARVAVDAAGSAAAAIAHGDAWWRELFFSRFPEVCARVREARAIDLDRVRETAAKHGARVLAHPELPASLRTLDDAPAALWLRGVLPPPEQPSVAVVGSRAATAYGRLQAARFAGELAELGVVIVSGGARGIDAEAHRAALRANGITVAVLGGGFGHLYPPEHAGLFDAIVEGGGAVATEFPCGVVPRPENFPRRNRLVSALSLVVLVVEAAERSGALLTARLAVEDQAREVACIPGPVDSTRSAGCHRAIREGWAQLAHEPRDVAELIVSQRSLAIANLARAGGRSSSVIERSEPLPQRVMCQASRGATSTSTSPALATQPAMSEEERAVHARLREKPWCGEDLAEALDRPWASVAVLLTLLARKGLARLVGDEWVAAAPP